SVVAFWLAAPTVARRLSREATPQRGRLPTAARATALRYAKVHWNFFERFVSERTHWLAPDNFQLDPSPVVAMRTSPTNIGLHLLATVSAHDLGFIGAKDMVERLEATFGTLSKLRRYRGHFYNWYDLNDLRVLEPPYVSTVDSGNVAGHLVALRQACLHLSATEPALEERLVRLADQAYAYVTEMDFGFLYDKGRHLFTIGYHPDSFTADDSHYDLLASEARLTSFLAIARNDVPVEHWFRLSRALTRTAGVTSLVSWSGSMFEYLMPMLVMRVLPHTLLAQACEGVVARQMAYARSREIPWGISESAYNVRDHQHTYQYRAFGVPDLALKRGLGRDLVVAPYAAALAALVDPAHAIANLETFEALGALGEHGFYDALDYTRPVPGKAFALVQANMAHHVGMTLVALTNVLRNDTWLERFHADPLVKSAELLLHERVPRRLVMREAQTARPEEARPDSKDNEPVVREIDTSSTAAPRVALLGSLPYAVMLNHSGSGYSRYDALAVTRWRPDSTADDSGQFCYLRDVVEGRVWSAGRQPVDTPPDWSRAWLSSDRVTLQRADGDLLTRTDITVVPADAAEVRRITVTNTGREDREIELTSYGEVVMAPPGSDRAHPAFSNLFVETEWHGWCTAITATRRPRSPDEPQLWCVHVVNAGRDHVGGVSYETDRAKFIGRGRTVRDPVAVERDGPLSGTTGAVLDPIFALRVRVRVLPGQSTSVSFTTLVATNRESAFELAGRYHEPHAAQRALDLAWTSNQIELRELGITPSMAADFQDIATQLLHPGGSLAPPQDELRRNRSSQPTLWLHGISGDLPIVLATIDSPDGLSTLHSLFHAHRYWRRRGLAVDLVVINARPHDYLQELRDGIIEAMVSANDALLVDQPGGVFVRRRDGLKTEEYLMLSATARVHIPCDGRTLSRILGSAEAQASDGLPSEADTKDREPEMLPVHAPAAERGGPLASIVSVLRPLVAPLLSRASRSVGPTYDALSARVALRFANGIGGLDDRGDYQMVVDGAHLPPAPWVNVIANPHGGFVVSERGAGCTWAENAYFYRLSPWHNDPVSDPVGDVLYIKDADNGDVWSATPAPIVDGAPWRVRHGAGSSTFEHEHDGVRTELLLGIPPDDAVKVSVLRIKNLSDRPRRLSVTAYCEWVLGARREETQLQVRTRFVPEQHAIFARNLFDPAFAGWTAYLAISEPVTSFTGDRLSFLGRYGTTARPAALGLDDLDGTTGIGIDPCAALQVPLLLAPGETREITVLLGAAATDREARLQVERLRPPVRAREAIMRTISQWSARLSVITVRTPEPAFDAMLNKWALYQALACRMWARTGLYQSSGAFGFRDQLQDAMAMVYAEPGVAREHILRAAARQFLEGDVQHWWHPHTGRGVRTRFSDDLAWLPFVVDHYVRVTGDETVLDQYVPFLTMRALEPHEHELYDLPSVTDEAGSVYEHCLRALRRASTKGPHGLPLIGTGDWNDGMSRVGVEGKGESVWLAWFLITNLRAFALRSDARGDHAVATEMRQKADAYVKAVESSGWDGQWYRRAYYDDGTPMGSSANDECRIDSIAQSWSVISSAGSPSRQESAMRSLESQLVDDESRIIKLLTPPFDRGEHDPGYIRGYLPGVRENGAQYTHAALWAVLATALRGDGARAFELFQMLNPLTHTSSPEGMARYKVEPYVVAADVYTAPGHLGRGGWTWYTGSASWMYRVGVEAILGLVKVGNTLRLSPAVPPSWREYEIAYRFGATTYTIAVRDPAGVQARGARVVVDGHRSEDDVIHLVDDGRRHSVIVEAASVAVETPIDSAEASLN
ncbi:MAG: hypothetical protein H7066_16785, partial [Cytophagaceae bacterium]|nr:hypothetical protein [Gemmatimonadaceae bacterium]